MLCEFALQVQQRFVNELNTPVVLFQLMKNINIENEERLYVAATGKRTAQGMVILKTKVPAEPEYGDRILQFSTN